MLVESSDKVTDKRRSSSRNTLFVSQVGMCLAVVVVFVFRCRQLLGFESCELDVSRQFVVHVNQPVVFCDLVSG